MGPSIERSCAVLKQTVSSVLCIAVLAAPLPALAVNRSFIIDGGQLKGTPGSDQVGYGIFMPDGTPHSTSANIVLPQNYKMNSTVFIQVRLNIVASNCNILLKSGGAVRFRPGFVSDSLTIENSGLTIDGPEVVAVPPVVMKVFTKTFKLNKAIQGGILDQKAGDHIFITITRQGNDGVDSCGGSLRVTSMKVIYTIN
jgi:hypothetical protein